MANLDKNGKIKSRVCNRAYKAHTDWLNHLWSPWEPEGYSTRMTNDIWLGTPFKPVWEQLSSHSKKKSQHMRTRASETILKRNQAKFIQEWLLVDSAWSTTSS